MRYFSLEVIFIALSSSILIRFVILFLRWAWLSIDPRMPKIKRIKHGLDFFGKFSMSMEGELRYLLELPQPLQEYYVCRKFINLVTLTG